MLCVFVIGLLLITYLLAKENNNQHSPIFLVDLLLGADGRISKAAAVMFGAFYVTTWILMYITVDGKFDATAYSAYMAAWVAPIILQVFGKKGTDNGNNTPTDSKDN